MFTREGTDLLCKVKITLLEALCGFDKVIVTHLDGRGIQVSNPAGSVIKPGMVKRIPDEGMPTYKRPDTRGDLYIQFDVEFPADNFAAVAELKKLETILPKRKRESAKQEIIDECTLIDATMEAFGSSNQGGNAYDEDDSEDDEGQGGVRCAQQ